ncbi:MAG: hypothetical protein JO366_00935 [Methylobacteriaceae bacterium]|nr:hypothetical protein [Methylobacteriaceae bacterium]
MNGLARKPIGEADLHAFADGFATAERRAEIIAFLESEPEVARRVADWCTQNEAIRRALGKAMAEPLPAALAATPSRVTCDAQEPLKAVVHASRHAPASDRIERTRQRRSAGLTSVVGAAILFGLATGWIGAHALAPWGAPAPRTMLRSGALDPVGTFAVRAIEAHETFASDPLYPVEISAQDKPRLGQWLAARLGADVIVPDLGRAGYNLLGGRLIATNLGPAVLLLFENGGGERLGLTFARTAPPDDRLLRYQGTATIGTVVWSDANHLFALSGPPDGARLAALARRVFPPPEQD